MGLFSKKPPSDKKPTEKRRYPRINTSMRVDYQIAGDINHSNCRIKDISEKGIRFGLYKKLDAGTGLKLLIYLEDFAEPASVIGKVAWIKETPRKEYPYEAGIEFEVFDPSLIAKIQSRIQGISKEK